jgi:hypothetical protein
MGSNTEEIGYGLTKDIPGLKVLNEDEKFLDSVLGEDLDEDETILDNVLEDGSVEEEVVEEVKINPAVETDAPAPSKAPAPLTPDSGKISNIKKWNKLRQKGYINKPEKTEDPVIEPVKTEGDVVGVGAEPIKTKAPTNTDFGGENGISDLLKKAKDLDIETFVYGKDIPEIKEEEIKSATEFTNTKYDPAKFNDVAGNNVWAVDQFNVSDLARSLKEYSDNDPNATSAYKDRTVEEFKKDFELGYDASSYNQIRDNDLNVNPDFQQNYAIDFTGENDISGINFLNIDNLQNYRVDFLAESAQETFSSGSIDKDIKTVNDLGNVFLTEQELEFKKLNEAFDNAPKGSTEAWYLLGKLEEMASDENYGERLFWGDDIQNLDLKKVDPDELQMFQESQDLADKTEIGTLKEALVKDYYKIVGLAEEIYNWDSGKKEDYRDGDRAKDIARTKRWDGLNLTAVGAGSTTMSDKDIELMRIIASTGKIPKDSKTLDGSNPLIAAFNKSLKDFKVINRAIQLNRDPLTTERPTFGGEDLAGGFADLFSIPRGTTDQEKKKIFVDRSEAYGFKIRNEGSKKIKDNALYTNMGQDFGTTFPHLVEWSFDTMLFKKVSGGFATNAGKTVIKAISSSKKLAGLPYATTILKGATTANVQAVNFGGGTLVNQLRTGKDVNLDDIRSSYNFGLALGAGHPLYDGLLKQINKVGPIRNFFARATNDFTNLAKYKTFNRVQTEVGSGFAGATTYQFGGVVTGGLHDENGDLTISWRTQGLETAKMVALSYLLKGIPGMVKVKEDFQSDLIRINTSGKLQLQSKNSAKNLGLNVKDVTNPNENSLSNLEKALKEKIDDISNKNEKGEITDEAAAKQIEDFKNDYKIIDTQLAINTATEMMKAESEAGNAPKKSEFHIVAQKLKNGEKLNERDGEVLEYYGLDGVNMLFENLGITKDAQSTDMLTSIILNESIISARLNGKSMLLTHQGITPINPTEFVAPKGTKARKNAREFLLAQQKLNSEIYELERLDSSKASASEKIKNKEAIKQKLEELLKYNKGGELYEKLQIELTEAATKAYEEDLAQADPSKGKVVEELTPDSFQKRYDESGFAKKDVKQTIAFVDKEGNKVINREFALEQRDFTPLTHEIPHSILKDSFKEKDGSGNITPEGIKMIDGVLKNLTPRQRFALDLELSSRYGEGIKSGKKETWYEENITVLAELIKRGEIVFTKSLGESLTGLVPAFKKFLPNIEVNAETGKGIFEMLKAQDLSKVDIIPTTEKYNIDGKEVTKKEFDEYSKGQEPKLSKAKITEENLKTAKENLKVEEEIIKIGAFKVSELEGENRTRIVNKLTDLNLGLVKKLAAKAANNPNVQSLEKGKRKTFKDFEQGYAEQLTKIINNYEPIVTSGKNAGKRVPFGAYLAGRLKLRYGNVLDDLKKGEIKTISIDTKEAKEVVDPSTSSSKTINDKLAKKPSETIRYKNEALKNLGITKKEGETDKDAIENKISEVITKAYEGKDITRLKQTANIPEAVAKLYADMFGITTESGIKALRVKAQNFPEGDVGGVTRARQFLIDNAAADFARIPRTKDDFVKAGRAGGTGVYQTKLGKALYNKNGKLTGSLKNYIDIISGKNVTVNGIEFNALVKGKKLPIYRDAQHIKAALDFHIRNRVLETLEPTQGKRIQMGAKFSEPKIPRPKGPISLEEAKEISKAAYEVKIDKKKTDRINSKGLKTSINVADWGTEKMQEFTSVVTDFLKQYPQHGSYAREGYTGTMQTHTYGKVDVFDKYVPGYKGAKKPIARFQYAASKLQLASKINKALPTLKEDNKARVDLFKEIALDIEKFLAIEGNENKFYVFEQLFKDGSQDQNHFLRSLIPLKFATVDPFTLKLNTKEEVTEEHTSPVVGIGRLIMGAIKTGNVEQVFKEIIEPSVAQGGLLRSIDENISKELKKDQAKEFYDTVLKLNKEGKLNSVKDALWYIRYSIENDANPFALLLLEKGVTVGEYFLGKTNLSKGSLVETQEIANDFINKILTGKITQKEAKKQFKIQQEQLVPGKVEAAKEINNEIVPEIIKFDGEISVQKGVEALVKTDKALQNGRKFNAPRKEIYTMDLDDTLIKSKSKVGVETSDGNTFKINATEFAKRAGELESEGAKFDFTEFEKIVDGKKGPLFKVLENINAKKGLNDFFILTARPAAAAPAIKKFFDALGYKIPLKNITGLGDGKPQAKAGWIMSKAAEGYNDFYFADDHMGNVKAVKDVLSQLDVKSKVQQAKFSKAKTYDIIVNDMIKESAGIETYKEYSAAKAKTIGASKGRFNFFIPASAEDFTGLLYKMLGKGKKGDAQMAFLKTNLLDTYDRAEHSVTQAKIAAANDFKALKNNLKTLPNSLSKPTGVGGFTFSHAVRVAVWSKQGMEIPGLSKKDIKDLNNFVKNNAELSVFTNELINIQKGKPYPKPGKEWLGGNITSDIINDINKVNRAEYQQEWRENIDIIFSEANMNKMEAAYGTRWREAMEDSLRRMKSGSNRPPGGNKITDGILDWLNNSVGAVMFLNTRTALLQTISSANFVNWSDNNIARAGLAFANQKQYWKDYMTLMNSDYLVERRNGLKINVSESEIADAVKDSGNKPKAAIAFLLSKGFIMTKFADSFAIASGGATFYRNRVKTYLKEGLTQQEAETKAFEDFRQIAEESQQSSNPNRISQQQASGAGRVILAWANTPMQYTRMQKRAAQDLINGRGDWKTHVSKIAYYGVVQNLMFNALQQSVFALGFGEDDDEDYDAKKNQKISRVANGMIDSQLKGLGIGGAVVVALKSTLLELGKQHAKDRPKYEEAVFDLLSFSPPLGSKVQKISGGLRSFGWSKKDMKEKGFSLDNPAYLAGAQVATGLTNIPFDRVVKKLNNMRGIVNEQSALWQKVALGLGWSTWDVGLGYYGGFDAVKPLTPEEEKVKKIDGMKKETNTKEQKQMLLDLGLSRQDIINLKYEDKRVQKILELQKSGGVKKVKTPESKLKRQFDSIKGENKPDQVKTLLGFGLTKAQVRKLKYEKDRVEKILELMKTNKKP